MRKHSITSAAIKMSVDIFALQNIKKDYGKQRRF